MACERFRDELAELAAGGPAPATVEAHLASCEACRAELAMLRQALDVADEETARLLAAEPSPSLVVRIRQAVAESEPSPGWRFGWLWPATAAAGVLLAVVVVALVWRDGQPPAAAERAATMPTTTWPRSTPAPVETVRPAEPSSAPTSGARVRSPEPVAPPRIARATPAEPEVLVPPGEAEALLLFASHLQERPVEPGSLLVADLSVPLPEPKALEIAPIEFVPLDPAETSGTD